MKSIESTNNLKIKIEKLAKQLEGKRTLENYILNTLAWMLSEKFREKHSLKAKEVIVELNDLLSFIEVKGYSFGHEWYFKKSEEICILLESSEKHPKYYGIIWEKCWERLKYISGLENSQQCYIDPETLFCAYTSQTVILEIYKIINDADNYDLVKGMLRIVDFPSLAVGKNTHKNLKNGQAFSDYEASIFNKNSIVKIAAGIPIKTSLDAMLNKKNKWKEDKNSGIAYTRYESPKNSNNYVEHYINSLKDSEKIKIIPFDEALQIIEKFGLNSAKLHIILSAYACAVGNPRQEFHLKGTDLIKMLGWDTHNKNNHELLLELANLAWNLNSLLVRSEWFLGIEKKPNSNTTGKMISVETSRMWEMGVKLIGPENLFKTVEKPLELQITVRPGLWTLGFLNQAGAIAKEAFYHFGWLSQKIMNISPYYNELALRLAMKATIEHYRGFQSVRAYLEENLDGGASAITKAKSDRRIKHNLLNQWNSALVELMNIGFSIEYKDDYPEQLKPNYQGKRSKGYFDLLLVSKLKITAPKPNQKIIAETGQLSQLNIPEKASAQLYDKAKQKTGPDIKKARLEAKVKAIDLAAYMGKTRAWLSQKEKGVRKLTTKEAKELLKAIKVLSNYSS